MKRIYRGVLLSAVLGGLSLQAASWLMPAGKKRFVDIQRKKLFVAIKNNDPKTVENYLMRVYPLIQETIRAYGL